MGHIRVEAGDEYRRFGHRALVTAVGILTAKFASIGFVLYQLQGLLEYAEPLYPLPDSIWIVGAPLLYLCSLVLVVVGHFLRSYKLDEESLHSRVGVLRRRHLVVPLNRVQHADVNRNIIERMFGLATLVVYTAGVRNHSVQVKHLDHEEAMSMLEKVVPQHDG